MADQRIIPELYCSNFDHSLRFYTETLGFEVEYARIDERFAMLTYEGARLMIEQTVNGDRMLIAGPLEYPYGRGMNLQIQTEDAGRMYRRIVDAGCDLLLPLEDRWYRCNGVDLGNRQFVVLDPDGYLLRFAQDLVRVQGCCK